jgi:hypothetical protein
MPNTASCEKIAPPFFDEAILDSAWYGDLDYRPAAPKGAVGLEQRATQHVAACGQTLHAWPFTWIESNKWFVALMSRQSDRRLPRFDENFHHRCGQKPHCLHSPR